MHDNYMTSTAVNSKEEEEEEEIEDRFPKVSFTQLYRFASAGDKALIIFGLGCAVVGGILSPIVNNIFGRFVQILLDIDGAYCSKSTTHKKCDITSDKVLYEKLQNATIAMVFIAIGQLMCGFMFCVCLKYVSEYQVYKTKRKFFESLLRQDVGWHDTQHQSKFISRLVQNGSKIQKATGENLGLCVTLLTSSFLSLLNALYHGWLLTLISITLMPILVWVTYYSTLLETKCSEEQDAAYGSAGAVATEVLGNIHTVIAYGGEAKEEKRYESRLLGALESGIRRGAAMARSDGLSWFIYYTSTALSLWVGTILIYELRRGNMTETYTSSPENVLIVYLSLVMASYEFGEGISYFEMFSDGKIAAAGFHAAIDRVPDIDSLSTRGTIKDGKLVGNIEIRDVHFSYPSRPEFEVLHGINITIQAGETVAFVGLSGCGKSTLIQLLQRFYDPTQGQIMFDNYDIKSLNVGWFRKQLGVVRQEPVLFNGTIAENLKLAKPDATEWEIIEACKQANAHDFIMRFPEHYNTLLGDRGALISGGQKQRIAIARALILKPSILLLDEATSALDIESQQAIQSTLEAASIGRTTLIVAHRLITVKSANLIIYIKDGQVLERGTHKQLLEKKGAYFTLYQRQMAEGGKVLSAGSSGVNSAESVRTALSFHEENELEDALIKAEEISRWQLLEIWWLNLPEWPYLLLGSIASIIQGSIQTVHGILFGYVIADWGLEDDVISRSDANRQGIHFLLLAIVAGLSAYFKGIGFSYSGEKLTFRLRSFAFKAMINQNVDWFDQKSNHLGALCTRLSGDAALVQGATGIRFGNLLQGFTTITISISIALFYSVKLGLLGILFVILLNGVSYLEEAYLSDEAEEDVNNMEHGSMLVTQTITQIRTISSLHIEAKMLRDYTHSLENSLRCNLEPIYIRGLVMGLSQSFTWFAYIILAFYGSHLMFTEGNLTVADVVAVGQFITFGTQVVAEEIASAPNYYKAKIASTRVLKVLKMEPSIKKNVGINIPISDIQGKLELHHVKFSYPNRPSEMILNDISFTCAAGQHIALVGPSGCGKSTCIQLIQRFYDPLGGSVKLDDHKLTEIDVECLRRAIGIVSQEAALFDRSIGENIAYGDNSREVTLNEIIEAAKSADIHDFILTLPYRYLTRVGQLGGMLSGGQKQRVAIARAIIRKPSILLLDEATSALDAETEEVIQRTLDTISKHRTCITISHHPSAIRNSNKIFVFDGKGKILDSGTHKQLLVKSRFYANLISNK